MQSPKRTFGCRASVHARVTASAAEAAPTVGIRRYRSHAAIMSAVSEIAVDSLRMTEFQLATGPSTPSVKSTTRRPTRTRRSATMREASAASTHHATAASTTCAAIREESVGKIL
jgi:hypothetical protein